MSGNSCDSALQTAPIVSDFVRAAGSGTGTSRVSGRLPVAGVVRHGHLAREVGELEFADLQLVAVLQPQRSTRLRLM